LQVWSLPIEVAMRIIDVVNEEIGESDGQRRSPVTPVKMSDGQNYPPGLSALLGMM
jgi:hypothetical protein